MKTFSVLTLFAAAFAGSMLAQGPGGVLTRNTPPDPATMAQHKVARLTSLLSLTDSQAAQATTIFTNEANAVSPIQTNLNTYRTNLQSAVKSNNTAAIDSISTQIGTATGQITALRNKADAAFYSLLTADQKTKVDSTRGFGGPGRGGRGPGGFGARHRGQ